MKNIYRIAGLVCAMTLSAELMACGGDSGTSANDTSNSSETVATSSSNSPLTSSSSSVIPSSSSDVIPSSSSDVIPSGVEESSSSSVVESSSSLEESSSSTPVSSSSKVVVNNYNAETGILTDERDGETYKTAKIGDQIWMGENLRYLHSITAENYCHGQDEDSDITDSILSIYGRRYSWITAMNLPCEYCGEFAYSATETPVVKPPHQGLCPTGWHIPSVDDWQELFNHASVESILSTDWTKKDHGLVGTDDFGFTLHSARFEVEDYPKFHVIEENKNYLGYALTIYHDANPIHLVSYPKSHVESYIRCLKD